MGNQKAVPDKKDYRFFRMTVSDGESKCGTYAISNIYLSYPLVYSVQARGY